MREREGNRTLSMVRVPISSSVSHAVMMSRGPFVALVLHGDLGDAESVAFPQGGGHTCVRWQGIALARSYMKFNVLVGH